MKPKNNKERKTGFLKFLGLFLLTVVMIVAAIYYNFKIPSKENELLRNQIKLVNNDVKFEKNFYREMIKIKNLIDSLNIPGQNVSYQNSLISNELVDLQKSLPTKDSTFRYDMYSNIIHLFVDLQESKGKLGGLGDSQERLQEYKDALKTCQTDLKQAQRDLLIMRSN